MTSVSNNVFVPIYKELKKYIKSDIYLNEPMARHTTFKVGGPAALFVIVNSLQELRSTLLLSKKSGIPFLVVGRGSNLLVADSGFRGIVVRLGNYFSRINIDNDYVQAGAAISLPTLIRETYKEGFKSLAFAVGIPGTLGGAIRMNAGAYGDCFGNYLRKVTLYTTDAQFKSFGHSEIEFDYRSSSLKDKGVILEATLKLEKGDPKLIKLQMERYFKARKDSQPLNMANAGSIFKNPPNKFAGKIIEDAGCKGWQEGSAVVSKKHANFIVNLGGAKASDIYGLMQKVQDRVLEKKNILLEPEITKVGNFKS